MGSFWWFVFANILPPLFAARFDLGQSGEEEERYHAQNSQSAASLSVELNPEEKTHARCKPLHARKPILSPELHRKGALSECTFCGFFDVLHAVVSDEN